MGGTHEFTPSPVIGANVEVDALIGRSPFRGLCNQTLQLLRQGLEITKETNPHLFRLKGLQLALEHSLEQGHQKIDLITRARPVLRGEGIGSERFHAPITAESQRCFQGLNPCPMAHHPGQPPRLGPTAIAIHDHGHMGRDALRIELSRTGLPDGFVGSGSQMTAHVTLSWLVPPTLRACAPDAADEVTGDGGATPINSVSKS